MGRDSKDVETIKHLRASAAEFGSKIARVRARLSDALRDRDAAEGQVDVYRKALEGIAQHGCLNNFPMSDNNKRGTCHDKHWIVIKCYACRAQDALREPNKGGQDGV